MTFPLPARGHSLRVERLSFFLERSQYSRFAEHAPVGSGRQHVECGCTKNVKDRPSGEPASVSQRFLAEDDDVSFDPTGVHVQGT